MMRRDWSALRVSPEDTIKRTLRSIDRSRLGIALVVDDGGRLLGTVTDGDVRRAILREVPLDGPVRAVMEQRFVSLPEGAAEPQALELMQAQQVKQVPVVDPAGRVVGIFVLPDLVAGAERANWAVIMAGGQGERLRPLTAELPKPMLPVGDQPLLEITVRRLVSHGFRRLFLSLHYRGERIEQHFRDGAGFGCRIEYLREPFPLDTGGALSLLPEPPTAPVLVLNGDLVTDVDFSAIVEYHAKHGGAATLCVREFAQEIPYGVVRLQDDDVLELEEKPVRRALINAGIYVLEPQLVARAPRGRAFSLPQLITQALAEKERVVPFVIHERWLDIGQPADYERVRKGLEP